jgi:uncharacterized protein YukE
MNEERDLLNKAKNAMNNIQDLIAEFKELRQEFTGSEHRPESGFFYEMREFKKETQQQINDLKSQVAEVKRFQDNQKLGLSAGKWIVGGGISVGFLVFIGEAFDKFKHWIIK